MPCDITITSVGKDSKNFIVSGNATMCGSFRVDVTIECGSKTFSGFTNISSEGQWEAIIPGDVQITGDITTTAKCHLNPFCSNTVRPPETIKVSASHKEIPPLVQEQRPCTGCKKRGVLKLHEVNSIEKIESDIPCSECSKNKFVDKLGTCTFCIKSAITGTIAGWVVFILCFLYYPAKLILPFALIISIAFTLLLYTHGVAYLIKNAERITKKLKS